MKQCNVIHGLIFVIAAIFVFLAIMDEFTHEKPVARAQVSPQELVAEKLVTGESVSFPEARYIFSQSAGFKESMAIGIAKRNDWPVEKVLATLNDLNNYNVRCDTFLKPRPESHDTATTTSKQR